MSEELDSLLIRLEADTSMLRRELQRADSGLATFESNVNKRLASTQRRFASMGAAVSRSLRTGLIAPLAAVLGGMSIGSAMSDLGGLQDVADTAGMTAEALQELRFAASQAGVDLGTLDGGLTRFARNMGEARLQTGGFYAFLRQHAPALLEELRATTSQSQALQVYADAMAGAATEQTRLVLAQEAFGNGGAGLVRMLADGSGGLQAMAAEARTAGLVLENELVARADGLGDEFAKASAVLDTDFKRAIVDLYPLLNSVLGLVHDSIEGWRMLVRDIGAGMSALGGMVNGGEASAELSQINVQLDYMRKQLASGLPASDAGMITAEIARLEDLKRSLEATASLAGLKGTITADDPIKRLPGEGGLVLTPKPDADAVRAAKALEDATRDAMSSLDELHHQWLTATGDTVGAIGHTYDLELAKFRELLEKKLITEEQFQTAREELNAIASANIAEAIEKESEAARKTLGELRGVVEGELKSAFSDWVHGADVSWKGLISNMLAGMAEVVFQAQVLKPVMDGLFGGGSTSGGGVLGAILGGIVQGAFAGGGSVVANRPAIVGERGRELFVPRTAGTIIPNHVLGAFGGGGGRASVQNVTHIDARGADRGAADRIARQMEAERARTLRDAPGAVAATRRRWPMRG